jgi:acyl-CoA-binding protein
LDDTFTGLEDTQKPEQRLRQKQRMAENSNDVLWLTEDEVKDFVVELYQLWGQYKKADKNKREPYFFNLLSCP